MPLLIALSKLRYEPWRVVKDGSKYFNEMIDHIGNVISETKAHTGGKPPELFARAELALDRVSHYRAADHGPKLISYLEGLHLGVELQTAPPDHDFKEQVSQPRAQVKCSLTKHSLRKIWKSAHKLLDNTSTETRSGPVRTSRDVFTVPLLFASITHES
jgi:hypothetical protein